MEDNITKRDNTKQKKIILISVIALILIAAIISTIVIVKNATAKEVKTGNENTQQVEIQTTRIEVVTDAQGETVTEENGEAVTVIITEPATTKSVVINGTTSKATTITTTTPTRKPTSNKVVTNSTTKPTTKHTSTAPTTLAQSNDARIARIRSETGVVVQIGEEANTWYDGAQRYGETDPELIAKWLTEIETQVNRYPSGFFKEVNDSHIMKISVVSDLGGSLAGYASYEFGDDLSIGVDASMYDSMTSKRVINHEIMHIIEKCIKYKTYPDEDPLRGTWDFIPSDAKESSGNYYTVYDPDKRPVQDWQHMYFVTPYAKTNAIEDRAETFADYMFRGYKQPYMQDANYPMPQKMKIICANIRKYFTSAKSAPAGSLPWEKLL